MRLSLRPRTRSAQRWQTIGIVNCRLMWSAAGNASAARPAVGLLTSASKHGVSTGEVVPNSVQSNTNWCWQHLDALSIPVDSGPFGGTRRARTRLRCLHLVCLSRHSEKSTCPRNLQEQYLDVSSSPPHQFFRQACHVACRCACSTTCSQPPAHVTVKSAQLLDVGTWRRALCTCRPQSCRVVRAKKRWNIVGQSLA